MDDRKESDMELISDATNSAASFFDFKNLSEDGREWFAPAVKNDDVKYVLVPYGITPENLGNSAFDSKLVLKDSPIGQMRMLFSIVPMPMMGDTYSIKSKYYLAALYKPHLKKGNRFGRCIELPLSVNIVMMACEAINRADFDMARELLHKADSLQNGAATYLLSTMYFNGFGDYPDKEVAMQLIEKAVTRGSRAAKVTIADKILKDLTSSTIQKAKAEDYLRRAVVLGTVASLSTVDYAQYALALLQSYYTSTRRFRDAYKLTKECMMAYDNPNVKYNYHLQNCVNLGKFREARIIIEEGESQGLPACYIMHARLLSKGLGYKQDVLEAEKLLRFTADSLRCPVYEDLSILYNEVGDTIDVKSLLSTKSCGRG